jgi:hypothetical protein
MSDPNKTKINGQPPQDPPKDRPPRVRPQETKQRPPVRRFLPSTN